jgi:hypothetical protein
VPTRDSIAKLLAEAMRTLPEFAEFSDMGIFYSLRPASPVRCITIYDNGGFLDGREMDGRTIEFPGIQFIVRDIDPNEAYRLIHSIWVWSESKFSLALGDSGLSLKSIKKTSTILPMGIEDKTLAQLYSLNVQVTISGV